MDKEKTQEKKLNFFQRMKEKFSIFWFASNTAYNHNMIRGAQMGLKGYRYYCRLMYWVFFLGAFLALLLGNLKLAGILFLCWHFHTFLNQIYWNGLNLENRIKLAGVLNEDGTDTQ